VQDNAPTGKRLVDLTWPEVAALVRPVLVVPTGSCEQHGPHLPFDTDTRIAVATADAVVARLDARSMGGSAGEIPATATMVVAPPLAVGASGEHDGFPGTLSIGTDAFANSVIELVRSADAFVGVIVINGHGGNVDALRTASAQSIADGRRVEVLHCSLPGGEPHAGVGETSVMLHLHPDAVRMDLAEAGELRPWSEIGDIAVRDGFAALAPNGVLGDPRPATADRGMIWFEELVERIGGRIAEVLQQWGT